MLESPMGLVSLTVDRSCRDCSRTSAFCNQIAAPSSTVFNSLFYRKAFVFLLECQNVSSKVSFVLSLLKPKYTLSSF